MKEKYYESTTIIIISIILIVLGMTLLIGKNITYDYLINISIFILWINSARELGKFVFRKLNQKEQTTTFLSCLFHITICYLLSMLPNLVKGIAPFLFAIYLILIGISQCIMSIIEIKNKEFLNLNHISIEIFCFSIAIPLLISPVTNIERFLICISIYCILLGITMLLESIVRIIPIHTKNRLKRKVRITLPKFIEAIIPYAIMLEINRNLSLHQKQRYSLERSKKSADLHILIHTSNRGFNKIGHIDIYYNNTIFSYGNYDEGSRVNKDIFGDGVLFTTNQKINYINFCIDNSKKTIFDFGVILTDKQKEAIQKRINEIMKSTKEWNIKNDKKYNNGMSYAAKLYKKTKAKFYKFTKGKYKTYFVLGTNCCYLVDDIVGKSGMDIISLNGIITPGTYYDYLNRELKLKNSRVVSKEIYNKERRAKKEK